VIELNPALSLRPQPVRSNPTICRVPPSPSPQVAVNDIGSSEDFLAAIDKTIKYFNDGDIVEGTIVKVDRDEVLLDIGYKNRRRHPFPRTVHQARRRPQ